MKTHEALLDGNVTTSYRLINHQQTHLNHGTNKMSTEECSDGTAPTRMQISQANQIAIGNHFSDCNSNNHCDQMQSTTNRMLMNWHSFGCRTTIHGISHIYQTENKRKRQIWFWLTLVGFAMTGIHLYFHTKNFLASPITTVIKHQQETFQFPDVTFCSLTPTSEIFYQRLANTTKHRLGLTQSDMLTLGSRWSPDEIYKMSANAEDDLKIHRTVFYHQRSSYSDFERSYYPYTEMIMQCTYFGETCKAEDFVLLRDPYYWNCYTFRPKNRNVTSTTAHEGLNVILYTGTTTIEQELSGKKLDLDDMKETTKTINPDTLRAKLKVHSNFLGADYYARILLPEQEPTGVRVTIHEAFTYPHPRSQGFVIGNGLYAKVGIEMTCEKKMNRKNQKCFDNPQQVQLRAQMHYDGRIETVPYLYDDEACVALHTQSYMIKNCKCMTHFIPSQHPSSAEYCYNYTSYINDLLKANNMTHDDLPAWRSQDKTIFHKYVKLGNDLTKSAKGKITAEKFFLRQKCHDELNENISINVAKQMEEDCKSHEMCISKRYFYFYSTAPYPRDYGLAEMVNNIILPNVRDKTTGEFKTIAKSIFRINGTNWSTNEDLIRQNFLKMVIHPLSIKSDVHQEEYTYNIWEALSELGGITGLWLGISCLTIFEIFDLLVDMLTVFKRKSSSKQDGPQNAQDPHANLSTNPQQLRLCSRDSNLALLLSVNNSRESAPFLSDY